MRVIASYTLSNQAHKVTVLLCRQCGSRKTVPVCLSHLCQPVVTDGDGSTPALRACHDSHDKAHRASGQPAPLSPKYRPLVLCTSRESPKSDPVCFSDRGSVPGWGLYLGEDGYTSGNWTPGHRGRRSCAASIERSSHLTAQVWNRPLRDPSPYHTFEEKATDNIDGFLFLIFGVNSKANSK